MRKSSGCMECYPKLCSCPLTKGQRINALILCLASGLWNEEEQKYHRRRLTRLLPSQELRTRRLQICLGSGDYGKMEKERLQKETGLIPEMQVWLEA